MAAVTASAGDRTVRNKTLTMAGDTDSTGTVTITGVNNERTPRSDGATVTVTLSGGRRERRGEARGQRRHGRPNFRATLTLTTTIGRHRPGSSWSTGTVTITGVATVTVTASLSDRRTRPTSARTPTGDGGRPARR